MKKILVVDNHPVILRFMTKLLEKEGHEVRTAADGLSALDVLKHFTPDVLFVDLIMPNIDGARLCRIIRKMPLLDHAYVVILSAIAAEEQTDFRDFGANACIAKGPFQKMGQHILAELTHSDQVAASAATAAVKGLEDIYQREITKELLSSKRHFEVILAHMAEGILELTLDAKIVYANPSAVALIGMPEEELLGAEFTSLFQRDDRRRIQELLDRIDHAPQAVSADAPVKLNEREASINFLQVREDAARKSILLIVNDISERKRMEAQLQQARRMEAIGTLAGGIAHDFNNLLMGIQGNASLMLLDIEQDDPLHEYVRNIERLVQSGSKLTSQLIGYARKGKYTIRPLDLNRLVEETSQIFGRTKKEIVIRRTLSDALLPVQADQGQIEQVLLNLYVNAWQAMPSGGEIHMTTDNVTHENLTNKLYHPRPGKYVRLVVSDTGVGMSRETQERIFEPFFTTHEMGRGTGLGLASVYGIVKGHGGYIDVQSEPGRGTTFTIYLPASEEAVRIEKSVVDKPMSGTEGVLLVDDEDIILDVGGQMLKELGYDVMVAKSGQEALDIYQKHRDRIDMVVLDMIMPGMNGDQTFEHLNRINPQIRVLLSSGYSIEGQARRIVRKGCRGFIQKPFSLRDLSRKLRESLG